MAIDDRSKESVAWSHRSNTMGVLKIAKIDPTNRRSLP